MRSNEPCFPRHRNRIFLDMATQAKKTMRARRSVPPERTVVYRGIKIAPMSGKRSPTAEAIRDALRTRSEQARGEAAHA